MICQIVNHTNERVKQLPTEDLRQYARLNAWKPVTCEEIYAYLGIRIYIGLHLEPCQEDYWATGPNRPHHNIREVMSRQRFEAIHLRMRVVDAEPGAKFETVFERVRTRNPSLF